MVRCNLLVAYLRVPRYLGTQVTLEGVLGLFLAIERTIFCPCTIASYTGVVWLVMLRSVDITMQRWI